MFDVKLVCNAAVAAVAGKWALNSPFGGTRVSTAMVRRSRQFLVYGRENQCGNDDLFKFSNNITSLAVSVSAHCSSEHAKCSITIITSYEASSYTHTNTFLGTFFFARNFSSETNCVCCYNFQNVFTTI